MIFSTSDIITVKRELLTHETQSRPIRIPFNYVSNDVYQKRIPQQ